MRRIRVFDPPVLGTLMETLPVGLILTQADDLEVVAISKPAYEFLGRPRHELEGKPLAMVIRDLKLFGPDGEAAEVHHLPIARACASGEMVAGEQWTLEDQNGRRVVVLVNAAPIYGGRGHILGGLACWTDVTRLKAVEQRLEESLAAEAMLLRESNHRIKNQLQLLAALVQMEARRDGVTVRELETSTEERLSVLAAAHEGFYSSGNQGSVNAAWLLDHVVHALNSPLHPVVIRCPSDLDLDDPQVTPVALAINEGISNALKHAFPDGQPGQISVSIERERGMITLEIADEGRGLPEQGFARGLGIKILETLARQLNGTFTLQNQCAGGVVVRLRFPESPRAGATHPG